MPALDPYFGRVFNSGVELELQGGFDFRAPLSATPDNATKRTRVTWGAAPVDLEGNPITNHHDYRGSWTAVATGAGSVSLGSMALGLSNTERRAMTVEIDVEDSTTRANAKRDVFVLLVQLNSTNTAELTDCSSSSNTDTGSSPSLTLTGGNSGYTYTAAYSGGALAVSLARDGATARNAQLTISAEAVRVGP